MQTAEQPSTQVVEQATTNVSVSYDAAFGFRVTPETSHADRLTMGREISRFTGPSLPMNDAFDEVVDVVGFAFHPASFRKADSGEWIDGTRVVFLLANGNRLSSFSPAIKRFVTDQLAPLFGDKIVKNETSCICLLTGEVSVKLAKQKTKNQGPTYAPQII